MLIKQHIILLMFLFSFMSSASSAEVIEFSSKDLQGNTHTIEQYRGKWIVVNFWGTFCGPCIREMPELSKFHDEHKDDDAVVLGINQEEIPIKMLANFTRNLKVSFPSLKVPFKEATPFGRVTILPTTFIINPQGVIVARQSGAITLPALEDYIARKKQQALQEEFKQARGMGES